MPVGKARSHALAAMRRFPSSHPEWEVPESLRHARLCELLYQVLRAAVEPQGVAGMDHFVYYDRRAPRRCLAPDGFVKLGVAPWSITSWKTWEHGVPEVCVEILSPSDSAEKLSFREKLTRYGVLGPRELFVFRADGKPGRRLRVWDRRRSGLVERVVVDERADCRTLGLTFAVLPHAELGSVLRLIDAKGAVVPTAEEAQRAAAEALRAAAEAQRAAAEAQVAALSAEVAALRRALAETPRARRGSGPRRSQ